MKIDFSFLPNGQTALYGIIGSPVSHSVSPAMQTAAFRSSGLNAVYLPFHIQQITPELKTAFNLLGVKGFNVTVPHKENIIPLLDTIDEQARFLRSVNTVKIENGHWSGYSTDGNGFILSLEEAGFSVNGKSVQVLGAGGSASAVCFALLKAGASHVKILNRTPAKTKGLAEKPADFFPEKCSEGFYQGKYDLLVNTTSAGMTEDILPCPEDLIYNAEFIADIIYRPSRTKLLQTAEHAGIPVMNGLGMLLYQGASAFEIWTGVSAPTDDMRAVLLSSQTA